ncbi:hypothetical protein R5R35_002630 [Gryllus longicercus]|uniref:Mediator of RNA polymerase II transcription subunit 15 n=1 Tax=Gryllus longicercus TaxID=2509291 RepID=A0AAN9YYZ9_9ORTH
MYSEHSWRNSANRQCVASKIEEATHRSNINTQRNGMEMEQLIFEKAKSKGEYFMFIALLIQKIRECGIQMDIDLAGPSYADIEQPLVDPLAEIPGLAEQGPNRYECKGRRGLGELDLMSEVPVPSLRSGSMLTPGGRSLQSEKYNGEYTWKTPAFRKSIIAKFDEAMYRYGRPTSKNSMEMEQLLFEKAKSREDYSSFAGRVLLYIREMGTKRNDESSELPISDIRDLIPDPLGDYMAKRGHPRRVHYPPYCYSGLRGTPKKLLGGG